MLKLSEIRNSKITVLDRNNYNFKKKNINFIKSNLENPKILKKVSPGAFGSIKPVGYCMIGRK